MLARVGIRRWLLLVVSVSIVFPACSGSDDSSPREAVESYFDAWNTRDIDQIMDHIADNASLEIDPANVVWSEPDDIRAAFETMFARSEWTIEVSDFEIVDEDTVTYNYQIYGPDGTVLERGRSEATVENGLIKTERGIGSFRDEG